MLELIIVVLLSTLVVVPLMAWLGVALRAQPLTRDGLLRTAHAGLLGTYFDRDVQTVGAADDLATPTHPVPADGASWTLLNRDDCAGVDGSGGRRLVVLWSGASTATKTVYTVARMRQGSTPVPGRWSVWRRECSANTGALISARQVLEDVVDSPAATFATCFSATNPDGSAADMPCREVQLTVTSVGSSRPLVLTSTRRVDLQPPVADPTGNLQPTVKITVVSRDLVDDGTPSVTLTLDAGESTDPEDCPTGAVTPTACPALHYRWELPLGPEGSGAAFETVEGGAAVRTQTRTLDAVGLYSVRLEVTDSRGAVNSAYKLVEVENRLPKPMPSVSPRSVTPGVDTVSMSDTASPGQSFDPDGSIVSYRWLLTGGTDGTAVLAELAGASASYPVPADARGTITVTLIVVDDLGGEASAAIDVEVVDPSPVDPEDPGGTTTTTTPPDPSSPVAAFTDAAGAAALQRSFEATDAGAGVTYAWDFGLLAGPGATGRTTTHDFPGPGTYTVTLTVSDGVHPDGVSRRQIALAGDPVAPGAVRQVADAVVWDPVPGTYRYLVDFEFESNGCARSLLDRVVQPSVAPSIVIPATLCPGAGATARVRVRTELVAAGATAASEYLVVVVPG